MRLRPSQLHSLYIQDEVLVEETALEAREAGGPKRGSIAGGGRGSTADLARPLRARSRSGLLGIAGWKVGLAG